MGYLIAAVIGAVVLVIGLVVYISLSANKRKGQDRNMPDGVTMNRPQEEGGNVDPKNTARRP